MVFICGTCSKIARAEVFPSPLYSDKELHCHTCVPPDKVLSVDERETQTLICPDAIGARNCTFIVNCPHCTYDGTYNLPSALNETVTCKCQRGCKKDFEWRYEFHEHLYANLLMWIDIWLKEDNVDIKDKTPQKPSKTPEQKMNERRDKLLAESFKNWLL